MLHRIIYSNGKTEPDEIEADEHAIEEDWLILKKFLAGKGPTSIFRVKAEDVVSVQVSDPTAEAITISDEGAIGVVWALVSASESKTLEQSLSGGVPALTKAAIRNVYRSLGVVDMDAPDDDATVPDVGQQRKARKRLGTLYGSIRELAERDDVHLGEVAGLASIENARSLENSIGALGGQLRPAVHGGVERMYGEQQLVGDTKPSTAQQGVARGKLRDLLGP